MFGFRWVLSAVLSVVVMAGMSAAQAAAGDGLVVLHSARNVEATVQHLVAALQARGMTVFARIDHQAAATGAGLEMPPTQVIVYGNPEVGTPLMLADPTFALQLPLKLLVTEVEGETRVIFVSTERLLQGSRIRIEEVAKTLARNEGLIRSLLAEQAP